VVPIQLRLIGGRIVSSTSSKVVPNVGHIHVYLDGKLVAIPASLDARLEVTPGRHELEADFVAGDHGPFNPPLRKTVAFEVSA
jgi:hypothetical protein